MLETCFQLGVTRLTGPTDTRSADLLHLPRARDGLSAPETMSLPLGSFLACCLPKNVSFCVAELGVKL